MNGFEQKNNDRGIKKRESNWNFRIILNQISQKLIRTTETGQRILRVCEGAGF
jgi:hypothetical protein